MTNEKFELTIKTACLKVANSFIKRLISTFLGQLNAEISREKFMPSLFQSTLYSLFLADSKCNKLVIYMYVIVCVYFLPVPIEFALHSVIKHAVY